MFRKSIENPKRRNLVKLQLRYPSQDRAVELVAGGFCQPVTAELVEDTRVHLAEADFCLVMTHGDQDVAFALFRTIGDMLYLVGIMVDPEFQGKLISQHLVLHALSLTGCKYLGLRTQNPVMWSSARHLCSSWYPTPDTEIPTELLEIAQKYAVEVSASYPVAVGFYGQPLYGTKPMHRNPKIQSWWDSVCDFERADTVFCFGQH